MNGGHIAAGITPEVTGHANAGAVHARELTDNCELTDMEIQELVPSHLQTRTVE